ncbi:MAG: bifunctional metallophosphatase/5'-nucleotidase [Paucibacter sp.]|nr:bifunctional metallophosphatase/5'-nucleotidase [Roseateles sp.]
MSKHPVFAIGLALLLSACAAPQAPAPAQATVPVQAAAGVHHLNLLAINDFHGNIQASSPVPLTIRPLDPASGKKGPPEPAGGIAYLATAIKTLRAARPGAVLLGGGDFIGASPQTSSMLADEPTLAAFAKLDVLASALGNHELDRGLPELLRKTAGQCPAQGCSWPGFTGVPFPFLAANLFDDKTGKLILQPYVIKEMDGIRVAFVGAATLQTPAVSLARNMTGLRFTEESAALNALVPELRAKGAKVLIAVMHEGTDYLGEANVPSYDCGDMRGRGVDILQRLDPAYAMVIGGHSHRAYVCKIGGRLITQAGSFGGWVTDIQLEVDDAGKLIEAKAVNEPVLQSRYAADPAFAVLAAQADALTAKERLRPVVTLKDALRRQPEGPYGDAALGNLIADAQLAYARKQGPVDLAMMNPGGIRTDIQPAPGTPVTVGDLFAVQPFHNELVALTISGADLRAMLLRGLPRPEASPRMLQVSSTLRYEWTRGADGQPHLMNVTVGGLPLDPGRDYRLVVNGFMADGGESLGELRRGRDRVTVGEDLDALVDYLGEHPQAVDQVAPGRILFKPSP